MLAGEARHAASDWIPFLGIHRNPESIVFWAILANMSGGDNGGRMQILSAKDAKYGFGRLIDLARADPVAVAKHGRPVVVVMAIEEYQRLKALDACEKPPATEEQG